MKTVANAVSASSAGGSPGTCSSDPPTAWNFQPILKACRSMMATIKTHVELAEMNKETSTVNKSLLRGRPRLHVDTSLVLRLRDVDHLGWTGMADEYQISTRQFISRDTIKRRYIEAKAQQTTSVTNHWKVSPAIAKHTSTTPPNIKGKKGGYIHTATKIIKSVCPPQSQLRLFQ